ncbi:DUF6519 domain-containing protein, partial [Piscinibacter sp.]|uniref:DUF6519 domain-containing protein n=1 Tax=Piscinibacter sp. TaxID=1903157 RepID=UPI002C2A24F7
MNGDFSFVAFEAERNYTSVRHQQGRVLLDRDWNDAQAIEQHWRTSVATDAFGLGVLAVPAASAEAFKVLEARLESGVVRIDLAAGRAWASGMPLSLARETTFSATYVAPPLAPAVDPGSIAAGVRDAVLLEVFEDTVSGFQDPAAQLIEPALGGPDTTQRVQAFATVKLVRLGANEDCSKVAGLIDDPAAKGKLSVTPSPVLVITSDCPLEAGGGYTGLEHFLYRIEVAEPAAGKARFKWSQFNGGLVGRGMVDAGGGWLTITGNDQAIGTCGIDEFYLEALRFNEALGVWTIEFTATAKRETDGRLSLSDISGTWPAAGDGSAFFRLWNGIEQISQYAAGTPTDFVDGLQLAFDAPAPGNTNYRPGDYWTFPVRASGAAFEPPVWPLNEPPAGVVYRRVALGVVRWQAGNAATWARGEIDDCRRIFRPLTNQKICCAFNVGDGRTSFGDFNSIELALRHLPAAGGEICLLPGLHTTNTLIAGRANVVIRGCGAQTRVLPREATLAEPIFTVRDSARVEIDHMDLVTVGGTAIQIEGSRPGGCDQVSITRHRILACTHAVSARNASHLAIAHNRIRMIDKAEGRAAIDVAADDVLIERNDIALVPAEHTPPVDPEDPIDPVDPCAELERVYLKPLVFAAYLDKLWLLPLPLWLLLTLAKPYRALGGIHVRGGSERVRILENQVAGGAGNGVTLGSAPIVVPPPAPPVTEFRFEKGTINGQVIGPGGMPLPGVQITMTRTADGAQHTMTSDSPGGKFVTGVDPGTYRFSEGAVGFEVDRIDVRRVDGTPVYEVSVRLKASAPPPENADAGFLYDIAIERNHIAAMGLCGIGVPAIAAQRRETALQRAHRLLGSPVIGLSIRDNRILRNLRNPFDNPLRALAATRGLGGISLGLADDVEVTGNRIEGNGLDGAEPVCGVFIEYGESIEVARNVLLDNGAAPQAASAVIRDGQRGGIVLGLAANFGLFAALRGRLGDSGASSSAARILANHVEQPVGCALLARAFGPVMINDNVLASDRSSVGGLDAIAGAVLVVNLAGVQARGPGVQIKAASSTTQPVANLAVAAARAPAMAAAPLRAPLLPFGAVLFNDNQVRAGAAHTSPLAQLLVGYDDVGFDANQCYTDQAGNVFANALVLGTSLRATGNRLRERSPLTAMSLLTISSRANNTSFNQGDHCI